MLPSEETNSPSLPDVLQKVVIPRLEKSALENLVVARNSWKEMQAARQELPDGVRIKRHLLQSKPVRLRNKKLYDGDAAQVTAHWPQDKLYSRNAPLLGFVIHGVLAVPLGDYTLHCTSGHSFLVLPGTPHSDGSHSLLDDDFIHDGSREVLYLMVRGNGIECWLSRVRFGQRVQPVSPGQSYYVSHPLARQYLETIAEEMKLRRVYGQVMSSALMIALMSLVLREMLKMRAYPSDLLSEISLMAASTHRQTPMSRAEKYVQSHLHEKLSIDKIAGHLYMSRAYFTRLFRAHTGKTFVEYVTQCRLQEAKVLLRDTQWPISRISEVVGLKPSRFRAIFHSELGQSPSEFRQQARQEKPVSKNISKNGTK